MADKGHRYEGGLVDEARIAPKKAGGDSRYRNWVAYEATPTSHVTIAHVMGEVLVANPGVKAKLTRVPEDNKEILLLRIDFIQRPGNWPAMETWITAIYAGALVDDGPFAEAQVVSGETIVVVVPFRR